MKVCEECKGTGTVTLFTTSGPCKTCARKAAADAKWLASVVQDKADGTAGWDKIGRGQSAKKKWTGFFDSLQRISGRESKSIVFQGCPRPFRLRMIDFEKLERKQVDTWSVFVQEYNAAADAEMKRAGVPPYCG